jgi:gamma-glutamyl:cysteine ligase YbdK (ATP-grasp superfamily)
MVDLVTGRRRPTRERLRALVEELEPAARELGGAELLAHARESIERNGAIRQREACRSTGIRGLPEWLADRFLED